MGFLGLGVGVSKGVGLQACDGRGSTEASHPQQGPTALIKFCNRA